MTDDERRRLIVQQCRPGPRNPARKHLRLDINTGPVGSFISTPGAKAISCSSKQVFLAEMAHLYDLLEAAS